MGHGKETPRQKMIGMMYLVLMAMLALNVSNEVLNAFAVIDNGLSSTKETINQTNEQVMANFNAQNTTNSAKVGPWYNKALEIQKEADDIVDFINEKKLEIVRGADGDASKAIDEHEHIHVDLIKAKDNTDVPARIMVGDANDKAGKELGDKMRAFEDHILNNVFNDGASEKLVNSVQASLSTADGKDHKSGASIPWERANFEHLPLVGVISIMTGLQINVRNAESEALRFLYTNIDKGSFKFNNLNATVIPNTNYLIKGNEYAADIFLAASDTTAQPNIYVGMGKNPYDSIEQDDGSFKYEMKEGFTKLDVSKSGKGTFKLPGNSLGERHWGGFIEMDGPGGEKIVRTFKRNFLVAEGAVVVSPTKMNVFYLGVENPIDVSVAGVMRENVSIEVTNARSDRRRNSYIIKPRRPGNCIVKVYAKDEEGKRKLMGTKDFRVKKVPSPVAKVNGKTGGAITKQVLLAQIGVAADLENFDFDLKFTVTEFTVSTTIQGFLQEATSKSYKFSKEQKNIIQNLNRGQRIYIQDIKAVGPDGQTRDLSSIALLLN